MQLSGSRTLNAPQEQLFQMLLNPDVLTHVIPSLKTLEVIGQDTYKAICEVKLGPVSGTFAGEMEVKDQQPPESFVLVIRQNSKIGNVDAEGKLIFKPLENAQTEVFFEGEAKISGLLARTGQRVISGVANTLVDMFFKALEKEIEKTANPS